VVISKFLIIIKNFFLNSLDTKLVNVYKLNNELGNVKQFVVKFILILIYLIKNVHKNKVFTQKSIYLNN